MLANDAKLNVLPPNSSYLVWVAIIEAIILPALLPAIILGIKSAYIRAWTTPIWYIPIIAPPLSNKAVLPTACLTYPKNYNFLVCEISALLIVSKPLASSYWYCSTSLLEWLNACLYKKGQFEFAIFLLLWDLIIWISFIASPSSRA